MTERAAFFVDGNNWYHGIKRLGHTSLGWLNYAKVSRKLVAPRSSQWVSTRYYIGRVPQRVNTAITYSEQRKYMSWLEGRDARISIHYGRLEERVGSDGAAAELKRYLGNLTTRIDPIVYKELQGIASRHHKVKVTVEKAVDVMLPAAHAVASTGKKVIVAAPGPGARLASVVHAYIRLRKDWFTDCFGA